MSKGIKLFIAGIILGAILTPSCKPAKVYERVEIRHYPGKDQVTVEKQKRIRRVPVSGPGYDF